MPSPAVLDPTLFKPELPTPAGDHFVVAGTPKRTEHFADAMAK